MIKEANASCPKQMLVLAFTKHTDDLYKMAINDAVDDLSFLFVFLQEFPINLVTRSLLFYLLTSIQITSLSNSSQVIS